MRREEIQVLQSAYFLGISKFFRCKVVWHPIPQDTIAGRMNASCRVRLLRAKKVVYPGI
jgi:hypothetical protein